MNQKKIRQEEQIVDFIELEPTMIEIYKQYDESEFYTLWNEINAEYDEMLEPVY